jgi:hypothetical protein
MAIGLCQIPIARFDWISMSWKLPVAPYNSAMPNKRMAEAKDPVKKYFTAASADVLLPLSIPTNT